MSHTTQNINSEREAYIQDKMNGYRKREAFLQGRKMNYFDNQTKKNKEWCGNCQLYTMITVFALVIIAAIAIASVAACGLLI